MLSTRRALLALVAAIGFAAPASAQITWNFTYLDGATSGFNNTIVDGGETLTRGQLRRNTVDAAAAYLGNFLDGRGTVNIDWNVSEFDGTGFLASFGPDQLIDTVAGFGVGSFQSGGVYKAARSNAPRVFGGPDGGGTFDFGYLWNYEGQNNAPSATRFDMLTVAIHEITHGLGFLSYTGATGQGLAGQTLGNPDLYAAYDRFLQRGNGPLATAGLFNTNIANAGYASFTGDPSTMTNGSTNTTTGLFFGGANAREVFGGPVPLYAPNPFEQGSSVSHVDDTTAVMNPSVGFNDVKRFRAYEIAMLMDIGWNVYNWNSTAGNWGDGIGDLSQSRWTTDSGLIDDGAFLYNTFNSQAEAPILPVYGQTTANIILNFRGSGGQNYTATNNLGTIRLSRVNLNSSSTNTITLAGGTLNFGLNADGSPSVLAPKIVQQNTGAFEITSLIQTNNIATQIISGATFIGHSGLAVEGTGSGEVILSGDITGTGGLTKNGLFVLTLSGTNSYAGTTTVTGGTLRVNGQNDFASGAVSVSGGILEGTGSLGGPVTVGTGGRIEAGNSIGTLGLLDSLTVLSGGLLRAELGAGNSSDTLNMVDSAGPLDLKDGSTVGLVNSGFDATAATTFTLADLNGTGPGLLQLNGADAAAGTVITVYTEGAGTTNVTGNVNLTLTGFALTSGDTLTLRRDAVSGDLVVVFTPVPEPGTVLGVCALAAGGVATWRRWRKK